MGALPKEDELFTYAEYKTWNESKDGRFELIYGVPYAMAAPSEIHQLALGEIYRQIANYLHGKSCKVFPAPYDVRLFYREDESDDTIVQPDITVICDQNKRGPEGCRGAPELVMEILSPSNTVSEMDEKLNLYRKAGVHEYWIVDPVKKRVTVYNFQDDRIMAYIYGSTDNAPVIIFPDLQINLEQVFSE